MKTSTIIAIAVVGGIVLVAAYVLTRDDAAPFLGGASEGGAVSTDAADAAAILGASGQALQGLGSAIGSIFGSIGTAAGNAASGGQTGWRK